VLMMTLDEAPQERGGAMKYALQALLRRRLLLPVIALVGLLLLAGCATAPYMVHMKRGREFEDAQINLKAEREYREAVRLKPDYAEAHYRLGVVIWAYKRDEGVVEIREAIRLKPDFTEAHESLGTCLFLQNKLEDAEKEYREVVRLRPTHVWALWWLGHVLDIEGRRKEARQYWEKALKYTRDPNLSETFKQRLAEPD